MLRSDRNPLAFLITFLAAACCGSLRGFADEEERPFRPGLVLDANYRNGQSLKRVVATPQLVDAWSEFEYLALPAQVRWSGELRITVEGSYRFAVASNVDVGLKLADRELVRAEQPSRPWREFEPIDLALDNYSLAIEGRVENSNDQVHVYWKGQQFEWEPLNARYLVHRAQDHPPDEFARGELLAHALRCGQCHGTDNANRLGPSLGRLQGQMDRNWLVAWLAEEKPRLERRMPAFEISTNEAEIIADYLLDRSQPPTKVDLRPAIAQKFRASVAEGKTLAFTLGCLACHKFGDAGQVGLFGGSDLTHVAIKRPADFFAKWLVEPAALNPTHRMPVFDLTPEEREHLAAYLGTLTGTEPKRPAKATAVDASAAIRLLNRHRCANCHELPKVPDRFGALAALSDKSNWQNSCAGSPNKASPRPGYQLPEQDQAALQIYYSTSAQRDRQFGEELRRKRFSSLDHQLRELNCRACHNRDDWAERMPGEPEPLPSILRTLAEDEEELAPLIPAMSPPSLNSVGDKLTDETLRDAIIRKGPEHRTYLKVMMPKFPLTRERAELLSNHFIYHDRVPAGQSAKPPAKADDLILAAGGKLASTEGFGCVSCHQIGKWKPDKAPLNARGPELLMPGKRIRQEWFERWVRNPARIVPRMEMPSLQLPVRGVLGNKLEDQIDALWTALNTPGFSPPLPSAVRIVRKTGVERDRELATVLTDVLEADGKVYIKPFIIALPNRHNVMFDCETGKLVRWWVGDAASQKTRGKSWYWEVTGENKVNANAETGIQVRMEGGDWFPPAAIGQFALALDSWRTYPDGSVELAYRLQYPAPKGAPVELRVVDHIAPVWPKEAQARSGFTRKTSVTKEKEPAINGIRIAGGEAKGTNLVESSRFATHDDAPPVPVAAPWPAAANVAASPVAIAPGWKGSRLPFPEDIMPTGIAWRPDGRLVFSSLKGNVWQTKDADNDGVPDAASPFSDEFATPYGIAAGPDYVDVATKSALLRLHGEERCEQVEVIADGWGQTADYHDWVIGLPQDKAGNYYLGIPCQQDQRSAAAAKLRGTVIKLAPQSPTMENPRRFKPEVLTRGHRFPMGLALSRAEALFVTDNQGNYNPFNELNHVRAGVHFGFVNALEKKDPRPPVTPPAIDIPHPWTRSVNGICFLDTPAALVKERGALFGPFEGQLVGCEYDTRRLIRMSLQEVDGTYQGAAYPLTMPSANPADGLLGPIVCAISPRGELYVGNLRDSGWGGGNNIGDIVRIEFEAEKLPAGIAEVRAEGDGLHIRFTSPVDRAKAADPASYRLASYRRESTPAYGGPDQDRRDETLAGVVVAEDGLSAALKLRELREGFVYEIFVKSLAEDAALFFPAEAYFTLRKRP